MSITVMANIADLLAAMGVIASLLFLGAELRRSNRDTRQANWRELLDSYRDFKAVTNDLKFAEFLVRARADYHALTPAEKISFDHYQEQGVHVMSNFFKHDGTVPDELEGLEVVVGNCLFEHLDAPGARAWLEENKTRGRLMPGTYARIDAVLARGRVLP